MGICGCCNPLMFKVSYGTSYLLGNLPHRYLLWKLMYKGGIWKGFIYTRILLSVGRVLFGACISCLGRAWVANLPSCLVPLHFFLGACATSISESGTWDNNSLVRTPNYNTATQYFTWAPAKSLPCLGFTACEPRWELEQKEMSLFWGMEGEGRIGATQGWISEDRGSKATLPLTIPRRVFKSSAKDSTRRSVGIVLHGDPCSSSATRAWPTTRAFGGREAPTAGRQTGGGRMRRF